MIHCYRLTMTTSNNASPEKNGEKDTDRHVIWVNHQGQCSYFGGAEGVDPRNQP